MKTRWRICVAVASVLAGNTVGAAGDAVPSASPVKRWEVTPSSLVAQGEPPLQKISLTVECPGNTERTARNL